MRTGTLLPQILIHYLKGLMLSASPPPSPCGIVCDTPSSSSHKGNRRTCAQMVTWKRLLPPVPALSAFPRNRIVGPHTVDRRDCGGRVQFAQSLERVGDTLTSGPGRECVLVWCGGGLDCRPQLFGDRARHQPTNHVSSDDATDTSEISPWTRQFSPNLKRSCTALRSSNNGRRCSHVIPAGTPQHLCGLNEGSCRTISRPTGTTFVVGNHDFWRQHLPRLGRSTAHMWLGCQAPLQLLPELVERKRAHQRAPNSRLA